MNIYKIVFRHISPKDNKEGLETLLLAASDRDVYDYIDKEHTSGCWSDRDREDGLHTVYDDDCNLVGTETYRERMLRLKGELDDGEVDLSDAYYGITLYGWELLEEDVSVEDFDMLRRYGLLKQV